MIKRLTDEQIAEAKKNGLAVMWRDGVPYRVLSKEQTRAMRENWDDEFHCPKGVAEFWRKVRERERERKKM